MSEIIKGFQTTSGIKQYDYDSLSNKPDLSVYLEKEQVGVVAQPHKLLRLNENGALPADVTGKAGSVDWTSIQGTPSDLSGFGLDDEVYTKNELYNKKEIDELIENVENAGTDNATALRNHNTSKEAHEYIRELIDQLSSDKINKTDIINDLTSLITDKPLSAAQGAALKKLIDEITVPTKLSDLEEDENHRTVTDAEKEKWDKPSIEVDTTLTKSGMAADAQTVGKKFDNIKIPTKLSELSDDKTHRLVTDEEKARWDTPSIELDSTLAQEGMAADAKAVGDRFGSLKIPTKLSELTDDETHRTVTDSEKENWNAPAMVAQNDAPQSIGALWIDLDDDSVDGNLVDETLTQRGMAADAGEVGRRLNGKVEKIDGKGLSANDYTTDEKNKLAGIQAEANKTIVDNALSDTSINPIQNKVVQNALSGLISQVATKQDKILTRLIVLPAANWVDNVQTVQVEGVTSENTVISSPSPASFVKYNEAGAYCANQGNGSLVFSCESAPEEDLEACLVIFN